MITMTKEQVAMLNARLVTRCTTVEVRRWDSTGRYIEVHQFERQRLIESVKIAPGGSVTVLS